MTLRHLRGFIIIILLLARAPHASSQPFRPEVYPFPVLHNGAPVEHPFTGGFYNPMHQFVDIDTDGDPDLFILDISDGSFTFWRNTGSRASARFRQEVPSFTMPSVTGWFRFADVTGDGLPDLMTAGDSANSLAILRNTGTPSEPAFTLFDPAVRDSAGRLVVAETYSIGAFADMDGDGDRDFFSLNSGLGTINHYQNIGGPGLFRLAFRTDRWQNIQICVGCNGPRRPSPAGAGPPADNLHGNGSMEFTDIDGDRDFDMLYGDNFDNGLFFFRNIGTPALARLDSVTDRFPAGAPVITGGFNQPTLVDIDGDRDLDMFVSVLNVSSQVDNFWFYRNTGDSAAYAFALETRGYLGTVDVGFQSAPSLADIDADGDLDLFAGNLFGPRDGFAHVAFYRNAGTRFAPAFTLADTGFVNSTSAYAYVPRFADVDADGDLDMLIGHFAGRIEFHRNIGTPQVHQYSREISFFDSVAAGSYAAPELFDLDADGDLDLFVGRGNGRIMLYRNTGSPQSFRYLLETPSFLGFTAGANAKPQFADVDGDGDRDLVVGNSDGRVFFHRNDGPPGNPSFTFVTDALLPLGSVREAVPFFADIDADGDPDAFTGVYRGGLLFHRNLRISADVAAGPEAMPDRVWLEQNFPNPFNGATVIRFTIQGEPGERGRGEGGRVRLAVYDLLGREVAVVMDGVARPGEHRVAFDGSALASGVYLYRLEAAGRVSTRTMILLR